MCSEVNFSKRIDGNVRKVAGSCRFLPEKSELSPIKYFKHVGNKVIAVLRVIGAREKNSTKVTSAGTPKQTIDSQRAEAIDDCIEFINATSSLTRSKSVSC